MGHWKQLLEVDLTSGSVETRSLTDEFARTYLGGAGFTTRILYDRVDETVDPLSPENVLVMAPGVLVGHAVPTGSKTTFGFKSPLTGGYGKSLVGGKIGDKLKRAGYDALVVTGAAEDPVTLVIDDDDVSLEDASDLWGKDTRETDTALKDAHDGVSTAIIGQAGERQSKISIIECEDRQAGRGGPGAVMGSKNLKAIAITGSNDPPVARPDELKELNKKWRKETVGAGDTEVSGTGSATVDMEYGTGEAYEVKNTELGVYPTRNWQSSYFKKAYDRIAESGEERVSLDPRYWTQVYRDGRSPCPYCSKPCSQWFVANDTPYGDIEVDGPEYETQYSLGGALEIDDIEAVAKANEYCDRWGLDVISAGISIAWAMEAAEKGLIDPDFDLSFGSVEGMFEALERMAFRDGDIGELLADGAYQASQKLGQGEEFAIHVKGMAPSGFEARGTKGMGLAFAVAPRGADHLTSCFYALDLNGSFWEFEGYDRTEMAGKALALKFMEDLMALYDMTGVCKFTRGITYAEGIRELTNAVTGFDYSMSEFMTAGERVYNVSKVYNLREGFSRDDDVLPDRLYDEQIPDGPSEGQFIDRDAFQHELGRYYDARGWDADGAPLRLTLADLDLGDIAATFGRTNEQVA